MGGQLTLCQLESIDKNLQGSERTLVAQYAGSLEAARAKVAALLDGKVALALKI